MRFEQVEDLRDCELGSEKDFRAPSGVLVLNELFMWWHTYPEPGTAPDARSKLRKHKIGRNGSGGGVIIGYGMMEEVGIVCFENGGCAVRIVTREQDCERFELLFRVTQGPLPLPGWTTTIPEEVGIEGSDQWNQALANALDKILK
ncbi:unnamed protein product, partial [Polarella glacialis]